MSQSTTTLAARIYFVVGLGSLLWWLSWRIATGDTFFLLDPAYLSFAVLCLSLGLLQPCIRLSVVVRRIAAYSYATGAAAFVLSYVWRYRTGGSSRPEGILWFIDLAAPALMLGALLLTLWGVFRAPVGRLDVSRRIYLIGGLSLCLWVVVAMWYGATAQWYDANQYNPNRVIVESFQPGDAFKARLGFGLAFQFSYPIALAFSMGALFFGSLPHEARPGIPAAVAYITGCFLLAAGAAVEAASIDWYRSDFFILGAALAIPSVLVALLRIVFAAQEESGVLTG